ncbi:MAG: folate-binding protein YgfZ [Magnetococcales bacterium]|nr:folate-binding protein YgfZ [Magnetococcales bacterium]
MQRFYSPSFLPQATTIHPTTDRGEPTVAHFGDETTEYQTLLEQAAWVDFSHMGKLALTGQDRIELLGGLTTNQMRHLTPDRTLYAALLTPQGRFLWDFTVHHHDGGEEQTVLLTEPDRLPELLQQISFYKLRAKVRIRDARAEFALLGLVGPRADRVVSQLFPQLAVDAAPPGATFRPEPELALWRDPRHGSFGWRLLIPSAQWLTMRERLSVQLPPAGWSAWEAYRLHHALPRGGSEFIPNETLPLEAGLLEMNGVDFGKGCYVGQETTARTHHRGTLKKRLFQVRCVPGAAWEPGHIIHKADGKEVGLITSTAPAADVALALLRTAEWENREQEPLFVQGLAVTVCKPSWARWT